MFMGIFVVLFLACAVMSVGTQWCVCVRQRFDSVALSWSGLGVQREGMQLLCNLLSVIKSERKTATLERSWGEERVCVCLCGG